MCTVVVIDGVDCETIGELRAALPSGAEIVMKDECHQELSPGSACLCAVNVADTLVRNRYAYTFDVRRLMIIAWKWKGREIP